MGIGAEKDSGAEDALEGTDQPERRIKIDLKMRDTMQGDLLKGAKEYALEHRDPTNPVRRPYEKFRRSEVVIHRLGDDCYPTVDVGPGISSWFKLELFDF